MKERFIQIIWLDAGDQNNNIIFYECLFYYIKNKDEDNGN
jgi:hypothetical protein